MGNNPSHMKSAERNLRSGMKTEERKLRPGDCGMEIEDWKLTRVTAENCGIKTAERKLRMKTKEGNCGRGTAE